MAGRQARRAGGQRQKAGGAGRGQQPALLQQPQDVGGGEGLGGGGGRPLLQVSALVFLLLGAAVLEPDLHLGVEQGEGCQRGRGEKQSKVAAGVGARKGRGRGVGRGEQGCSERGKKSNQTVIKIFP